MDFGYVIRTLTTGAAGVALVALGGCAVMSKGDCEKADWRALGLQDGSRGQGPDQLEARKKACLKNGITADAAAYGAGYGEGQLRYCTASLGTSTAAKGDAVPPVCEGPNGASFMTGYAAGLRTFCTAAGGYDRGRRGGDYLGQCPSETVNSVTVGLRLGKEVYELNSRLSGVRSRIASAKSVLEDTKSTYEQRRDARVTLESLREEEQSVRDAINRSEIRAARL